MSESRNIGLLIGVTYGAALLLPPVGFFLALVLLVKDEIGHGLAALGLSIAVTLAFIRAVAE